MVVQFRKLEIFLPRCLFSVPRWKSQENGTPKILIMIRSFNSRCTKIKAVWFLFSADNQHYVFWTKKLIRPCPHESIFVWQRRFFSPVWSTAHLYSVRWKWSPKTHLSKTLSRDKSFINAVLLYLCRRMKTEVFANDYLMVLDPVYPAHELRRHHLAGSDTSKCACSHWRLYRFQCVVKR